MSEWHLALDREANIVIVDIGASKCNVDYVIGSLSVEHYPSKKKATESAIERLEKENSMWGQDIDDANRFIWKNNANIKRLMEEQ